MLYPRRFLFLVCLSGFARVSIGTADPVGSTALNSSEFLSNLGTPYASLSREGDQPVWARAGRPLEEDGAVSRGNATNNTSSGLKIQKKTHTHKSDKNKGNNTGNKKNKKKKGSKSHGRGPWRRTGITFFGQNAQDDSGIGYTGVDLIEYHTFGLKYRGKPLFPAAVFQGDGAKYLYKILEVKSAEFKRKKTVYVHVVDVCNSAQRICRKNAKLHGFLTDIHATVRDYVGMDDGMLEGKVRVVGEIGPRELPRGMWRGRYVLCRCRGNCRHEDGRAIWRPVGKC
jgi:hypothetical protein